MEFTITFIRVFSWGVYLTSPVLVAMGMLIISLGLIVGRIESWTRFNSIYWSFITALTVGYGDIRPVSKISKALSIVVGAVGLMLGGILVAISIQATAKAYEIHTDPKILQEIQESLR